MDGGLDGVEEEEGKDEEEDEIIDGLEQLVVMEEE